MSTADPDAFGPFLVLGRLGAGDMGTVYLGRLPGGRRVAIKTTRADQAAAPGVRERFRREVHAARRISGFWTAPVVDADPDAATPWVATAYLDAPDLGEHVWREGPLPAPELPALAAGLAEALAAIDDADLIHRDLKPANILITEDGSRVIGFGIARADTDDPLTTIGGILGTPGYISPEQANGEITGPASDVFSLGAVLYYAATGTSPFGHGTVPALLHRIVHDEPDLTAVPDTLRTALSACLHNEPARRPTAAALMAVLHDPSTLIEGGRYRAPEPTPASRTHTWCERPAPTARRTVPLHDDSPAANGAWWSITATVPEPSRPAFATVARAVVDHRAEHAAARGPAPGPRVDAVAASDVVEHTRFGIGTVIEVEGNGPPPSPTCPSAHRTPSSSSATPPCRRSTPDRGGPHHRIGLIAQNPSLNLC
ncbi:protein kinase [Streptomyces phaeochromogenes]|uniref:protein kinase domain-containing protein n=1 Tax=Streptomyces phaeochromogenes TaxID=1923 RepID=UPI00367B9E68